MSTSITIYNAPRGDEFKNFIKKILKLSNNISQKYIDLLTSKESIKSYESVFTTACCDPYNNYERFEQLGDVTINKFIVWYCYNRFPQLDCTLGVKIIARLRINYGSKSSFEKIADNLGFWEYISAPLERDTENPSKKCRNLNKKDLLEDVFEAFIGCTEFLVDKATRVGVGYAVVFDILSNLFDKIDMSLKYEDLYDSKTILKETLDTHKTLGTWVYINYRSESLTKTISELYLVPQGKSKKKIENPDKQHEKKFLPQPFWTLIGYGVGNKKDLAEQLSAKNAINNLKQRGIYKEIPKEYAYFENYDK